MIDLNDEVSLRQAEQSLDDRERMALCGYMMLKGQKNDADVMAYAFSRPIPPKANDSLLRRKALNWLESAPCQAFMRLYHDKARKEGAPLEAELSETELMLQELDELKAQADSVDDKAKIIKMKADIRHKNRSELQNETTSVNFYLPMRCNEKECPLYDQALRRLQAKDKNFQKELSAYDEENKNI